MSARGSWVRRRLVAAPAVEPVGRCSPGRQSTALGDEPAGRRCRALSIALSVALALTVLTASLFVARFALHDCPGDGCAVCQEISTSLHMIGQPGLEGTAGCLLAAGFLIAVAALTYVAPLFSAVTPISLRTRLDL